MQILSIERLLLWGVITLISFGPLAVGIFPIFPAAIMQIFVVLLSVYAFSSRSTIRRPRQIALVLLSTSFALTATDLIVRPIMSRLRHDRPEAISPHARRRLPQVYNYLKNVNYRGTYYGDLAIFSGKEEWREYRDIRFVTDRFGFRNEPAESDDQSRPIDLIMLGDSFGEGLGVSQESTWCSVLGRDYGLRTYNLSVNGAGPWQELVNLTVEIDRLRTGEKTVVLWALYAGNDLDQEFYPQLEKEQLPWLSPLDSFLYSFKIFRWNSQLRNLLLIPFRPALPQDQVLAPDFIDGRPLLFFRHYEMCIRKLNEVVQHPNYEMLKATMTAMRKLAETKHFTVAVVLIPCKEETYSWVLNGEQAWTASKEPSGLSLALKALSQEQRFLFLDLEPSFVDASKRVFDESRALLFWRDDTHWNNLGHEIAASIVYRELLLPFRNDQSQAGLPMGGENK